MAISMGASIGAAVAGSTTPVVLVLNGPNLNRLGTREPAVYGHETLDAIMERVHARGEALGLRIDARQSNHEGHLVDWLHEAADRGVEAVILNAGGFTHTSVALRDAVAGMAVPVIEVHLSNPAAREGFRHRSHIAPVARGVIQGFGALSYLVALDAVAAMRQERAANEKGANG
jgi:3-dehydroquinate dehydratase-2